MVVHLPGEEEYERLVRGWNLAVVHAPKAVVAATTSAEVRTAVRYAASLGLRVRAQATGHGAVRAATDGLLIDTSQMRGVTIDEAAAVAEIEPGTPIGDVVAAAAGFGLAPVSGSTSLLSATGFALNGGVGFLSRRHGLCADWIEGAEIVTADGRIRWAEPDLLDGLRGGGPNFGVVTRLRLRLAPVRDVYAGGLYWPIGQASQVLAEYKELTAAASADVTSQLDLLHLPDDESIPAPFRGLSVVRVLVCSVGDPDETDRLLRPLRAVPDLLLDEVATMPYTEIDTVAKEPGVPSPIVRWTGGLTELTGEVLDRLGTIAPRGKRPYFALLLRHVGGAGPAVPEFLLHVVCPVPDPDTAAAVAAFVKELDDAPQTSYTGVPLSLVGDPAQVPLSFTAERLEQLRSLRKRYDPNRMFGADLDLEGL